MKNNKIKKLIKNSVIDLLNNTISEKKVKKIAAGHAIKTHFIPIKYRIFGGLLQSLNIQFGNFIEVLIHNVVEQEKYLEIISDVSNKKNVALSITEASDSIIDRFITNRQTNNNDKLNNKFKQLLNSIIKNQKSDNNLITTKHDIDVLFKDTRDNVFYYVEVKYNDDHDTGKFVDINRKFIKTYAGLVKKLNIQNISELKPILYYFNRKIMKGNIYVPEKKYIYRGEKLFDEFFEIKYSDLDDCLQGVSEDKEIVKIFDNLYKKIRYNN